MQWQPAADRTDVRFGRMRRVVRECGRQGASLRGRFAVFVTLTYRPDEVWSPSQIRKCLNRMSTWSRRAGFKIPYTWVMELTRSGVPHYHIVLWLPKGRKVPFFDARGWWSHGSTQTERARDPQGRYLAKYVSKNEELLNADDGSVNFPYGCRVYGRGGFSGQVLAELRYWLRPSWLRVRTGLQETIRKVKGGYLIVDTGEILHSPFKVYWDGPRMMVLNTSLCFPSGADEMQVRAKVREVREVKRGDEMRTEVTLETAQPIETHTASIESSQAAQARMLVDGPWVTVDVRLRGYRDRVFLNVDAFHQDKASVKAAAS